MTRRNPPAKWVLPTTVVPTGSKCMTLLVPDDPAYIAAYRGAILELCSAYNWADDEAHTAKLVAQVMREAVDAGECSNMEFIQRGCDLFSVVGGVETLIYTAQTCIDNNIADGSLQKANSGYIGNPASGACHNYEVALKAGNTFVLPNVVNTGDTILLSNWQGGATDWGLLSTLWICPSGTTYAAGSCTDIPRTATSYGTDPLQTAPHLAIIAQIGNTYYDVWNSVSGITPQTFVVPAGITNQPVRLLMNVGSGVAMTATGEMWGEVTVCNVQWCYKWDFRQSNGGWSAWHDTNNEGGATWVVGEGWQSVYVSGARASQHINLRRLHSACSIVRIKSIYDLVINSQTLQYNVYNVQHNNVSQEAWSMPHANGANSEDHIMATTRTVDEQIIEFRMDAGSTQYSYMRSIEVHGIGANPFGASNC